MSVHAVAEMPIVTRGLTKRYGGLTAVDHIDLRVEPGDVYGYLGPNGAGKTTSMRMLLGLIRPTGGEAYLFGRNPLTDGAHALEGVADFVEAPRFYPYLDARTNLRMMAAYDGGDAASRIDEALELVDLSDRATDKVSGYSHGMRQRLGIAGALIRRPKLLLLDEPATGLDPAGMRDMRALIRRLADQGMTVLLSSHLMDEVQELCNRVGIVQRGRMIYEGTIADLQASHAGGHRLHTSDDTAALVVLQGARGVSDVAIRDDGIHFTASDPAAVDPLSIALAERGIAVRALVPLTATLEELFFALTEGGEVA